MAFKEGFPVAIYGGGGWIFFWAVVHIYMKERRSSANRYVSYIARNVWKIAILPLIPPLLLLFLVALVAEPIERKAKSLEARRKERRDQLFYGNMRLSMAI